MENLGNSGSQTKSSSYDKTRLHPPLSDPVILEKVPYHHKLLCQSSQEPLPAGEKRSRIGHKSISRVLQLTFLGPKAKQQMETYTSLDLSNLNQFLKLEKFKMETPETVRTSIQQGEWVSSVDCKGAYFHTGTVQEIYKISYPGQNISVQSTAIRPVHSPHGVYSSSKGGKTDGHTQGFKHPPIPRRLVGESHRVCLIHTQGLVQMCLELGWLVNLEKSELEPKQVFDFVGYQFNIRSGRVRPTPGQWKNLQEKILTLLS